MCITFGRHDTCFWDGRPCVAKNVTKCEKDGKVYIEKEFQEVIEILNSSPNTRMIVVS